MTEINIFKKISDVIWEIPMSFKEGMKVPARIIASEKLLKEMDEGVIEQITNVACLPGILGYAYALPDAHWGYGAPVGAVFATDPDDGIISPGAVGFDLNCGMRLIRTNLMVEEVKPKLKQLVDYLFARVPAGVGSKGFLRLDVSDFKEIMRKGASWCVGKGYGKKEDLENLEEGGCLTAANPDFVSEKAIERGMEQLGTLGSGNHYLEVQVVDEIFDPSTASQLGINSPGQVVAMVHCGSRGFGHQVASDYLRIFENLMDKYGISVYDKQLACLPFKSEEGQKYYGAMAAAANSAFANRQLITHRVRECFEKVFGKGEEELGTEIVYDVAHNIAKIEKHLIPETNLTKEVLVHRKGATRSFPDQPVIVGGSMETGSYLMKGTSEALKLTFGSTCHGSGRTMSRSKAKKEVRGDKLSKEMEERGIYVRTVSYGGLAEEAGLAYKDISEVVAAVDLAGISKKVASFRPVGNIKG